MGIERVRYRAPVHPGDVVEIEAHGAAAAQPRRRAARHRARQRQGRRRRHDDVRARPAHRRRGTARSLAAPAAPRPPSRRATATPPIFASRIEIAPGSSTAARGRPRRSTARRCRAETAMPRVSRSAGPCARTRRTEYATDAPTLNANTPLRTARARGGGGTRRQQPFVRRLLNPEASRGDRRTPAAREIAAMRDGEERNAVKLDALDSRVGVEDHVEEQMTALVGGEPDQMPPRNPLTAAVRFTGRGVSSCRACAERGGEIRRNHHKAQQ